MPSKHLTEKGPVLIRPLVLKLPIDFHCGGLWGSDLLWFLAHTNAKLSHLEAGSVFRDSATTPPQPIYFHQVELFFFFHELQKFHHNGSAAQVLASCFFPPASAAFRFYPFVLLQCWLFNSDPNAAKCQSWAFFKKTLQLSLARREAAKNTDCQTYWTSAAEIKSANSQRH